MAQCENPGCYEQATHRTGWGNTHERNLCVGHTNFRETLDAWSRGILALVTK